MTEAAKKSTTCLPAIESKKCSTCRKCPDNSKELNQLGDLKQEVQAYKTWEASLKDINYDMDAVVKSCKTKFGVGNQICLAFESSLYLSFINLKTSTMY